VSQQQALARGSTPAQPHRKSVQQHPIQVVQPVLDTHKQSVQVANAQKQSIQMANAHKQSNGQRP
jgi:hypothetical protein